MTNIKRLILFAVSLALASCAMEPLVVETEHLVPYTAEAKMPSSDTKTHLNGKEVLWNEGDMIAIYDGVAVREFVLSSGAGTKHATFQGEISATATSLSAVYPCSSARLDDGVLSVTAPVVQTISTYSIDDKALTMSASAAKGEAFMFRNQVSLLRFTVSEGFTQMLFAPGGAEDYITVNLPGTEGTYEVALTPGEYQGLTVLGKKDDKWYVKSTEKLLSVERNHIKNIGSIALTDEAVPIRNSIEMLAFLSSASVEESRTVVLLSDVGIQSDGPATAADFSGVFDGLGHKVTISSSALFSQNHGTVKNLTIEGSLAEISTECSPIAIKNYGVMENIHNNVMLFYSSKADIEEVIVLGGLAAYNYGTINNCSNSGQISLSAHKSIAALAMGGIAGYSEGPIENCTNNGLVAAIATHGSGVQALGALQKSASNIGGILGLGMTNAPLTSCTNNGEVQFFLTAIDKATADYSRNQIGGIVGSPYGDVTECINHGKVHVEARSSANVAFADFGSLYDIGGIAGGSYHQTDSVGAQCDATSILSCVNDGAVTVWIDATKYNSPIGGIVGWPNGEKKSLASVVRDCENRGDITMEGHGKVRLGGVMAGTGPLENCSNSGAVTVLSADATSCIGGICAFHSQDHKLYACTNTGDVVSNVALDGVGGLIGNQGNVTNNHSEKCVVKCRVQNVNSSFSGTGMVVGRFNGTSAAVTLGSQDNPIEVEGIICAADKDITIDSGNYSMYLRGTVNTGSTHVIYAFCTVPAAETFDFAEGYVVYTDKEPAAGITVSDGFRVAVTDSKGYYKLKTSSDTKYIYISYPADAVVEKNSDGTPAFYQKYTYPTTEYDFFFTRQAVENEFMIFALADPQAHYNVRGDQSKADVYRFRDEAVLAINTQIAAQSSMCYGITLGDIVYSEENRNSNNGMSRMRTYCGQINMPVFQTMGNHDFTFFNASKPLSVSDNRSTLHLAAQSMFEDTFGPINYSFNRGEVHFVCMRNIIFDSNTNNKSYHCGFTDEQYSWLQQDLANVPKSKMVVLCVHIPLSYYTGSTYNHVTDVLNLLKTYKSPKIFSGHTHYKNYAPNVKSYGIAEHIHSAVCGQWWWSNIEGDGCPNGYTVYKFRGTSIADEYFIGQNDQMNTRDYQMRVYRGNLKTGGAYAYFQWPFTSDKLMINVFNGDSRWTVQVYENGSLSGNATLMANSKHSYSSVQAGETYTVPTTSNQDWWAIGYHIGVRARGRTSTSYYTNMFHMYTYTLKDPNASVKIVATDGYGNKYECTDIIGTDCWYPDYVIGVNAL